MNALTNIHMARRNFRGAGHVPAPPPGLKVARIDVVVRLRRDDD